MDQLLGYGLMAAAAFVFMKKTPGPLAADPGYSVRGDPFAGAAALDGASNGNPYSIFDPAAPAAADPAPSAAAGAASVASVDAWLPTSASPGRHHKWEYGQGWIYDPPGGDD